MTTLNARCAIGAAGAVSGVVCNSGLTTITKESGNGNYSVTLDAHCNSFLFGAVMFAREADNAAKTALSGVSQVDKLTFVQKSSCTAGDFCVITDTAGASWAFSLQTVAAVKDKNVVTFPAKAAATEGDFIQLTDAAGGKWALALDVDGGGVTNAGPIYAASTAIVVDISGATDAPSVALAVFTALTAPFLAVFTATNNLDGTIDFEAKTAGPCADAVPKNAAEGAAGSITFSHAVTGTSATPEPTSPIWTAIAAGKKVHVDISAQTTADDVCSTVRTAFAGLSGIGTYITVGAATGAYFECTHVYRKPVTVPAGYIATGAGAFTSFVISQTTLGVQTAIDPTNTTGETLALTAHGFATGAYVALSINSGALPTGWGAGNYYIINVDTNTVAFATTRANAEAGTKITISDYGDPGKTISVTPNAPYGSGVARTEFTSTTLKKDVQSDTKLYFTCYDYTGANVNPQIGSVMYIQLDVKSESESGVGV